jgi:FixJ family two-component response regulator
MKRSDHIVYVVDDDLHMRESIDDLLSSCDFDVMLFASAAQFIESAKPDVPACLVLDIELPDVNGLDLQRELAPAPHPPIVFITGHGDVPRSVRAMKAGAVDFLSKPFQPDDLVSAVNCALEKDRQARAAWSELCVLRARYASLTPREREVLPLTVRGLLNKQAAAELGISIVTLQIHRGKIMRKMAADGLADLVRMSTKLAIAIESGRAQKTETGEIQSRRSR